MKNTVYRKLKTKIISGELLPGSILVEREISDEYGLSRTPIREILWKLTSDGLLSKEYSKGYMVRKISLEEIFNIFQSREGIEGIAARLACQKGDAEFFANINKIKERIQEIDIEK
ncbi:unnamed protein product, partial [marine sediment metagenome]